MLKTSANVSMYVNPRLAGFSAPEDVDYLKWVSETKIRPEAKKKEQQGESPSGQRNSSHPPDSVKKQQKSSYPPPPPPCSGSSLSGERRRKSWISEVGRTRPQLKMGHINSQMQLQLHQRQFASKAISPTYRT